MRKPDLVGSYLEQKTAITAGGNSNRGFFNMVGRLLPTQTVLENMIDKMPQLGKQSLQRRARYFLLVRRSWDPGGLRLPAAMTTRIDDWLRHHVVLIRRLRLSRSLRLVVNPNEHQHSFLLRLLFLTILTFNLLLVAPYFIASVSYFNLFYMSHEPSGLRRF